MRFLFAVAAGYITGLLLSPKSGKENIKDLNESIDKGKKEVTDTTEKLLYRLQNEFYRLTNSTRYRDYERLPSSDVERLEQKFKVSEEL